MPSKAYKLVRKELGPVAPMGRPRKNTDYFNNLKKTCRLVDELLDDLSIVANSIGANSDDGIERSNYAKVFLSDKLDTVIDADEEER